LSSSLILPHNHRYWGKRDTKLILPTNSSLSVTLDQDHLRSTTTSRADPSFDKDRLWLNGKEESIEAGGRLATCIVELKRLRAAVEAQNYAAPKVCTSSPFRFLSRPRFRPAAIHLPGVRCFP
jgi:diphosphomevalonate decarboxylase